jgi:hypothetical protein
MVYLGNGYIGFNEYWETHPHSMIYKILHFGKELAG